MSPKIAEFHRLHQSGCFVIPNPWDRGSAIYLQKLGFKALATTSAGFAWSVGKADNAVTLDQILGVAMLGGQGGQRRCAGPVSRASEENRGRRLAAGQRGLRGRFRARAA